MEIWHRLYINIFYYACLLNCFVNIFIKVSVALLLVMNWANNLFSLARLYIKFCHERSVSHSEESILPTGSHRRELKSCNLLNIEMPRALYIGWLLSVDFRKGILKKIRKVGRRPSKIEHIQTYINTLHRTFIRGYIKWNSSTYTYAHIYIRYVRWIVSNDHWMIDEKREKGWMNKQQEVR